MIEAQKMWDQALRAQEKVWGGQTVLYCGIHIPCIPSSLKRGMDLGDGPPVGRLGMTICIRKSVFKTRTTDNSETPRADNDHGGTDSYLVPPTPGKRMVFRQREMEVESVTEDPVGAAWVIRLVSPDE